MSHLLPFPPQTSSRHPLVRVHMGLWFVFFFWHCFWIPSNAQLFQPAGVVPWKPALEFVLGVECRHWTPCSGTAQSGVGTGALVAAGVRETPRLGLCVWFKLRALEHFVGRKVNIKNPNKFASSRKGEGQWGGSSATLTISFGIMPVVWCTRKLKEILI